MRRIPMPEPEQRFPAFESVEQMTRRIIRDELTPVFEALETLESELAELKLTLLAVKSARVVYESGVTNSH